MAYHDCTVLVSLKMMCSALRITLHMQCLLDQLLLSRDEQGRGMNRRALRDELMTLLVAGQETSAILLGWACAFLAQHPEVQQQAAGEVQQVSSRLSSVTMAGCGADALQDLLLELCASNWQQCWSMHELPRKCIGRAGCTFPSNVTGMPYGMQGS